MFNLNEIFKSIYYKMYLSHISIDLKTCKFNYLYVMYIVVNLYTEPIGSIFI